MTILQLFLGFLKVGCFSFGGAYSAIPLIRDVVRSYGWMTDEMVSYMIGVSESTPGPIMVNLATFVGSQEAGVLGAVVATLAVILPAFLIILLLTVSLKNLWKNRYVQAALDAVKPCIMGIILSIGLFMAIENCLPAAGMAFDWKTVLLSVIFAAITFGTKPILKKKFNPLLLIGIAAVLGIIVYGF